MTKQDFIDAVVANADSKGIELTKKDAASILDDLFDVVSQQVAEGGRFSFPGFGTFTKKHRKARKGQNPRTGTPLEIPASNTVSFKPAPKLKDLVN
jgi:nucleoid DNA-binding protein